MASNLRHPLEPLTSAEVRQAVELLRAQGKLTPSTRLVSVSLKEPPKEVVHGFTGGAARGLRRVVRQRRQRLLRSHPLAHPQSIARLQARARRSADHDDRRTGR